jgi:hypothetical protein
MEGRRYTDNPNFIFYTPTTPSARQTEKLALLTHLPHPMFVGARR